MADNPPLIDDPFPEDDSLEGSDEWAALADSSSVGITGGVPVGVAGAGASDQDIYAVRLQVADIDAASYTFSDQIIRDFLGTYPVPDYLGIDPLRTDWTPTYDRMAAAADLWDIKAAYLTNVYDMNADRAALSRSQLYDHARSQARYCRSRSHAVSYPTRRDRQLDILYEGRWPFLPMLEGTQPVANDLNEYTRVDEEMYPR